MKIYVIPNGLEKYMAFVLNNFVFIDSMEFINSSLEKLVQNLSDNDFKYLTQEFGSKDLGLLKQKDPDPYEYMNSFKRFSEKKLTDKKYFFSSAKDETASDNAEKPNCHISNEEYLTCNKIGNEFNMKNMDDHDHYFE